MGSNPELDDLMKRAQHYKTLGYESSHAFNLAVFEARVEDWPKVWGNDFVALIFGDFTAPTHPVVFHRLGITIEPEKQEGTGFPSALTVLTARVSVSEKSTAAVKDAAKRLNVLAGALSFTNQGSPIRWWSHITTRIGSALAWTLGEGDPDGLLAMLELLPSEARDRVTAALYWIRAPRGMLLEHDRSDQLAVYAGYWNAFECLVDAVDAIVPHPRLSKLQKQEVIRTRLTTLGHLVGSGDIADLFHQVVDRGLRPRAEHAVGLCAGSFAKELISQCFDHATPNRGLYKIRNAINHGTVDVDDPETTMMIEARFPELFKLVYTMLYGVLRLNFDRIVRASGR